ncbi:MAG: amino acid adenylation domain-containing protein, partial [Pseudomonadota bacterium]
MTLRGVQTPEPGSDVPWLSEVEANSNLSRGQFLIWLGQKVESNHPLYNQSFAFHLKGSLDTEAFIAAFDQELSSNDALRTVIDEVDGVPMQRVVQEGNFILPLIDLTHGENPGLDAEALLTDRSRGLFSLDRRLFDSALIRVSAEHHIWFLNQHHVITDAWSCALLHDRVMKAYAGEALQAQPSFQHWVGKERASRLKRASDLDDAAHTFVPPSDQVMFYGKAENQAGASSIRIPHRLPKSAVDLLKSSPSVQRCISPDLGLVSAFASVLSVLVARLANIENVCIGLPIHNRGSKQARMTPGLFIEMLPLSVGLQENDTFETLFSRISNSNLDLLRHAKPGISTPQANREQSVVLNYINRRLSAVEGIERSTKWIGSGAVDSNHKIRLQVHDMDDSGALQLLFDLNTQVFDQNRQRDVVAQFNRLLEQFLSEPDSSIWSSTLASPEELSQYQSFNDSVKPYPIRSITSWLSSVAEQCASETCLHYRDQQHNYEMLTRKSDLLARRLQKAGVGPGVIVPIFMDKSPEAIQSILAVLKSGGTYLPLDWREPKERLRAILMDVAKSEFNLGPVLVGRESFPLREFSVLSSVEGLPQDDDQCSELFQREEDSIAYVIYTSGSTGTPKGVVISDSALLNYLHSAVSSFAPEATNFPLHSPLSVDLTVTSVFLPLLSGGKIVIFSDQDSDVPVLDAFRHSGIDAIKLTPSHLALLAELPDKSHSIKTIVVGGEQLKTATLRRVTERFPVDVKVYNEYGPTEATVGCMLHHYGVERDRWADVPIGKPIENASIYVLTKAGQFTPTGVVGELVISGRCLAEGYLNSPEQTSKKFFQHPLLGRCYRSGDLALWRDDGQLKLLGRDDKQLKIRGVRAEPEEIERTLASFDQIQDVVVRQLKTEQPQVVFCRECGMPSNHPDVHLDHEQ